MCNRLWESSNVKVSVLLLHILSPLTNQRKKGNRKMFLLSVHVLEICPWQSVWENWSDFAVLQPISVSSCVPLSGLMVKMQMSGLTGCSECDCVSMFGQVLGKATHFSVCYFSFFLLFSFFFSFHSQVIWKEERCSEIKPLPNYSRSFCSVAEPDALFP